ncbi:clusterin-associated protein 1 [Anopheles aquasalis]|uniref:clusterin-associated protein 1 n=1 Tax=Anopheles aquasalis TaxID=42839 RepID=UPI00215A9739|nr:clusterin-associated protein 1 [Anopheles aquasalis]
MAFKDVRDLAEQLKLLGYPNHIPLSVLTTPYGGPESFKAYSDILQWLINRLEPNLVLAGGTRSEQERVLFVRSATEFLVTKSSIKMNPRRLYASSMAAAQELLKVTSLLIASPKITRHEEESIKSHLEIDFSDKMNDLKTVRGLSSELTNKGAVLYDLLKRELVNREIRNAQSTRPIELATAEKVIKAAIAAVQSKLGGSSTALESLRNENANLESKMRRKASELERSRQRLQALQKVRPAYLEEFEKLEQELKGLYEQYIIRIKCVDTLRAQIISKNRTPTPTSPIARLTDSSMAILPEGLVESDDGNEEEEEEDDFDERDEVKLKTDRRVLRSELLNRDRGSTRFRTRVSGDSAGDKDRGKMIGSIEDELGPLDSSMSSGESESDLEMGENGLLDGSLRTDDDEDESLAKMPRESSTITRSVKQDLSDEDF